MFYTALFLLVIGVAILLCFTVLFKLETVSVSGSSRYSAEEIIKASGLVKGENLFRQDLDKASSRVEETLPYIGEAQVSRKLPAEIVITVSEAQIAGVVEFEGQKILLDAKGKVLEATGEAPENCPVFKGLKIKDAVPGKPLQYAEEEQKKTVDSLMQAIEESGLSNITEYDVTDIYNLSLVYNNRIRLELGVSTDLVYKLRFFNEGLLQAGKLTDKDMGTLDLSQASDTNKAYFQEENIASSSASSLAASSSGPESSSSAVSSEAQSSQGTSEPVSSASSIASRADSGDETG
ncbi:MAG: cell division protein FtsQ/DivIB [Hydrogeniiclostridium sp.]